MKTINFIKITILFVLINACNKPSPEIVRISEDMIVNESGAGEFMNWFDEQDTASVPETHWDTHGYTTYWPAGLIIDLGCKYQINSIWIYDGKKENRIEGGKQQISSGEPFVWDNSRTINILNSGKWVKIDLSMQTQFIQLQKQATVQYDKNQEYPKNCDLAIKEVIIMGYPLEDKPVAKEVAKRKDFGITMDEFIGMNSYMNTPDRVHEAIGCAREYRPWRWNGVTDLNVPINWGEVNTKVGENEYANMKIGSSDVYYKKMKDMGVECVPCIHRHVDEDNEHENIPSFGGDPSDPFSYKIMADYTFQYIARYGSKIIPDSLLRTTEIAPKKSGMNLLHYFENWNEPNRWWGDPAGHFTPYQLAAFCSASYDGHMNQMGPGFGAKNADPDINFVQGGLAFILPDYFKAMKLWSDYYRDGSFPCDVLNVHHYCNTRNEQHPELDAHGISPEENQLKEKMQKLVKWRDENLPDKEVWLSEFGWDTDSTTYISAAEGHKLFPHGITMEEIQAQWLVRGYLVCAAAGVNRVMMFLANDLKNYPHGVYGKCGFITVKDEYKPSWYYVKTMKTTLTGMIFHDEYPSGNENVWIYRFKNPENGKSAYVLWCPTSDGTEVDEYELKLSGDAGSVTKVTLEDKKEFGLKEELNVENNTAKLKVTERPVFVLVDKM